MHNSKFPPSLFLAMIIALVGCQSEDIHALGEQCKDFTAIIDETKICDRDTISTCAENHNNSKDALKQSDFEGAFKYGRCPKGYLCTTDIDDNKICKKDIIATLTCKPGDTICNNNYIHKCSDNNHYEAEGTACPADTHCVENNGNAQCLTCENGQQRCEDDVIQTCNDNIWESTTTCSNGYRCHQSDNNKATCKCQNGTSRCENNRIKKCQDGKFEVEGTECPVDAHCVENTGNAQCLICENDQQRCSEDGFIQKCKDNKWENMTGCPSGYRCHQSEDNKAVACGCNKYGDICESYEICQDGACQRKSCKDVSSLCGSKRCQDGECYNSNNSLSLCDNELVSSFWHKHYKDVIEKIIFPNDEDPCDVFHNFQNAIAVEGTDICNKIEICGNPISLGYCMTTIILQLIVDGTPGINISHTSGILDFMAADHSSCIKECGSDKDCSPYQQCNLNHECVRKPCSMDESICGKGYGCVEDVCLPECTPEDSKCESGKRAKICENGFLKSITCDTDYHCVKNGASVACVEIDN